MTITYKSRDKYGVQFSEDAIFTDFTIKENLEFSASYWMWRDNFLANEFMTVDIEDPIDSGTYFSLLKLTH